MVAVGDPILAADLNAWAEKPLVRLIQQSVGTQTIPNATDTAITFGSGSEEIDTHGFHDTSSNPSRITPTVAGYYRLFGTVWWASDTDIVQSHTVIGKNGSGVPPRKRLVLPSTATANIQRSSMTATAMLSANGSTDYFELLVNQVQASTGNLDTTAGGSFSSVFECEFLRPL